MSAKVPKPELMMDAAAASNGNRFAFLTAYGSLSWAAINDGRLSSATLIETDSQLGTIALSDDGKTLVAASGENIYVYDVDSGERVRELGPAPSIVSEVAAGNGMVAAGTTLGEVVIWDTSGQLRLSANGHSDGITGVAWAPGGQFLYTASTDARVIRWGFGHLDTVGRTLADDAQAVWGLSVNHALGVDLRP